MKVSVWMVGLIFLAACGKVGDPQPPFIRIPEAVENLTVAQSGYNIVLSWTNPPKFIDGSSATNLSRVRIQMDGSSLAMVETTGAGNPQAYVMPAGSAINVGRTFAVVVETAQGRLSNVSKSVSITAVDVPGEITQITATPDQRRIFLTWQKPKDHSELADAYLLTRADFPGEAETLTDAAFEDSRYQEGMTVTYQITPARRVAGGLVMGVGPAVKMLVIADKTPPAVPTGLEITPSDTGGFLTWEVNSEIDLAGYRLYRSERADVGFKAVSEKPLTSNSFFDPSYRAGLYYAVAAIDESGNESAKTAPFRGP
jgi:hypothetical protein